MPINIHSAASSDLVLKQAAHHFVLMMEHTLKEKPTFDVALSGGSTAQAFFGQLLEALSCDQNVSRIRFFFSDERAVALDSKDSNAGNAWRSLLKPLSVGQENFFPMFDEKRTAQECAHIYQELLEKNLSSTDSGIPRLDLTYLGIGLDGHTASLFPHSRLLSLIGEDGLVAAAHEEGIAHERITFMPRLILASQNISVLALGRDKSLILNQVLHGELKPTHLPAQLILRDRNAAIDLYRTEDIHGS